ncbi:type III toxin-antitoxin system CptIN family toxin [Peribacillus butanolivorans]|uniref:type III toxin-antitoxin system CptIN family toxin n=1 Tax=Peribacillus butanolivorans TaxID=421767 RepID=UPI0037C73CFC
MKNINLYKHYIYIIKDEYFEDFPDPNLQNNKGESRPNYFVFEDDNKKILWFIPRSSRIERFERIINNRESQGRPCDIAHICDVDSRKQALVTKDYIQKEYTVNRNPYRLVNEKEIKTIENKASRIKNLIDRGIKFMPTQPNVKDIETQLLDKLNKDQIIEKGLTNEDVKENIDNERENTGRNKEMRRKEFLRRQMNKER